MLGVVFFITPGAGLLTAVAVLVFAAVDGSIWLHLQVEPLLAEQPRHDAFQLWL